MLRSTISTFRVGDARSSESYYRDQLGFATTWQHDPGEGFPVFVEVSRDQVAIHLSEHEGDGAFGAQLYVKVDDAKALHEELAGRGAKIIEPLQDSEWGHMIFVVEDLDGNVLRFGSPHGNA